MLALRTLRTRVHLLTLGCVAPFVLHAVWTWSPAPAAVDEQQAQRTQQRATAVARHVDGALKRLDDLLDSATVQLDRSSDLSRTGALGIADDDMLTSGISVGVIDLAGKRAGLLRGSDRLLDAIPLARRRFIAATAWDGTRGQTVAARRPTTIHVRVPNARGDSIAVILARPLTAAAARCDCLRDVNGALVVAIRDGALPQLLGTDHGRDGAIVTVVDNAGNTIAGTTLRQWRTVSMWETPSPDSPETGADGIIRMIAHATIPGRSWNVFVGVPVLVAARVNRDLRDTLVLAVAVLLLASAGLALTWRAFAGSMLRLVAELIPFAPRPPWSAAGTPEPEPEPTVAPGGGQSSATGVPVPGMTASQPTDIADSLAVVAALTEFARATADQPILQAAALARLQQLAGNTAADTALSAQVPVAPRAMAVTHLRISDDQVRFDTMPPTRV